MMSVQYRYRAQQSVERQKRRQACFLNLHLLQTQGLLVEGLGVGGGGRDVGVTGSLVGAGGELELVGGLEVGVAGGAVGGGVVLEIEKKGEHCTRRGQMSDAARESVCVCVCVHAWRVLLPALMC